MSAPGETFGDLTFRLNEPTDYFARSGRGDNFHSFVDRSRMLRDIMNIFFLDFAVIRELLPGSCCQYCEDGDKNPSRLR